MGIGGYLHYAASCSPSTEEDRMSGWQAYKETMSIPSTLASAAKSNDVAMLLRLLAEDDASLEQRDSRGYSPLMLAAYHGHVEAFDLLLAHGADPNSSDLAGNSVLMGAAFKGHAYMVSKLIEAGADPSVRNAAGLTAHDFAVNFGRQEIVALLLSLADSARDAH
jgi:ankyrin repeat protein